MITPTQLAERMKAEILEDVRNGIVPATVGSFSDLHDYVDANCYGGTEALLDEMDADSKTDEEHCAALSALCDLANPAMNVVDAWIKAGGIAHALQQPLKIEIAGDQILILDDKGTTLAVVPQNQPEIARQVSNLPTLRWYLNHLLDGVEGYISEHGDDGRYWDSKVVENVRILIETERGG